MNSVLEHFDEEVILRARKISYIAIRVAFFVIYFWFGILKVMGYSPANALVEELLNRAIPFMAPLMFIALFGLYEMVIGVFFLVPRLDRIVIPLLIIHLIATFGPLVLLPGIAWQGWFIPTLEGQYIIKNLAIIAMAIGFIGHLRPLEELHKTAKGKKRK